MDIKNDRIQVYSGGVDEKGQKLEPEEQKTERVFDVDAGVNMHGNARTVGTIASQIIVESTVGEMAVTLRGMCGDCKYFDQSKWLKDLAKADAPLAPIQARQAVNGVREYLLQQQSPTLIDAATDAAGDFDIEIALRQSGYCYALFAYFRNLNESEFDSTTVVHATSSCPKFVRTKTDPQGFFEPRNNDAARLGALKYDKLMRMASSIKK